MKAYKGFNAPESGQLQCRDMVYEPGKTYKYEGKIELCNNGYHACEKFEDVFSYYEYKKGKVVYYEVECGGDVIKSDGDSMFVCSEITLVKELHGWWEEYDCVDEFREGFAIVQLNDKHNHINQEGKLLSDQWFEDVDCFDKGLAMVRLDRKWNYINTECKLLSNRWFDNVYSFREGFAQVCLCGRYNHINREGELVSNKWFEYTDYFREGFAVVELNGKGSYINTEGKLVSNQWFDVAWPFYNGRAQVKLNGKYNFINTDGKLLSDQWFDDTRSLCEACSS